MLHLLGHFNILPVHVCDYYPDYSRSCVFIQTFINSGAGSTEDSHTAHCCAAVDGLNAGVIIISKLIVFMF